MTDITENILKELTNALRQDINREIDNTFKKPLLNEIGYNRSIRFKFVINLQGAILTFATWFMFKPSERQEVFDHIKKYFEDQYGLVLINQRLYTYQITMEFGKLKELVDPMETYTLLKIKQII